MNDELYLPETVEDETLVTNFNKSDRPLYEKAIELSGHNELYIADDAIDIYGNRLHYLLALRTRECKSLNDFWDVYEELAEEINDEQAD